MKTIRTLVCRDFRRTWPLGAVWAVLSFVFFAYHYRTAHEGSFIFYQYFPILIWGMWIVLLGFIVHDAPPFGSSEFWMTRPISGRQLFTAKLIGILMFCVCLPVLTIVPAKILGLVQNEWIRDTRAFTSILLALPRLLVISLALMAVASMTRNTLQYLLSLFLTGFGFAIYTLHAVGTKPLPEKRTVMQYPNVFECTMVGLAIIGLLFIIYRQYSQKNRIMTLVSCVALGIILFGIWQLWPTVPRN